MKTNKMIKSSKTIVLSFVALMAASFATSCSSDNDHYADNMEQKTEEKAEENVDTCKYNATGMWRYEVDGKKYTLYVKNPSYSYSTSCVANFYMDGQIYVGWATLKNNVMTFETDSDAKRNIKVKATFANGSSKAFSADVTIDNAVMAKGATFSHLDDPNNIRYSIYFKVVDPDNELSALGIDIKTLDDEVKKLNDKTDTGNQRTDTAFGCMTALQLKGSYLLTGVMQDQCKKYPELKKSKVYVQTSMVETFGDVDSDYGTSTMNYDIY